jgi:integrase
MSVMKRGKKGVFYMNFMLNGKRIFRTTGKYTKREAVLFEAAVKQKMINNAALTPQELSAQTLLQDSVDQVYESHWKYNKDAKGAYSRASNLVNMIGNVPVGQINEITVARLLKKFDKDGAAPGTVNRYLAALKMILRIKKQDTSYIKLRRERRGRIRVISREEEQQILNLLLNTEHNERRHFYPQVGQLVILLADTGLRLGEALALKYECVDFTTGLISIWISKGDRPRSLPMTSRVREVLKARRTGDPVMVFSVVEHQVSNAWAFVRRTMKMEKDKEFVPHALRHTCASRLINKGIDLYVVKEWLGHASISTTQIYAHLAPHKLAEAVAVLEL